MGVCLTLNFPFELLPLSPLSDSKIPAIIRRKENGKFPHLVEFRIDIFNYSSESRERRDANRKSPETPKSFYVLPITIFPVLVRSPDSNDYFDSALLIISLVVSSRMKLSGKVANISTSLTRVPIMPSRYRVLLTYE